MIHGIAEIDVYMDIMKGRVSKMKRYIIRDREAGNIIEECDTLEEAVDIIDQYELEDDEEGIYTPNFYEVYDSEKEEVL